MKKEQILSVRSEQVEDLRERLQQRRLLDSDWDLLDGLLIFLFRILQSAEEMRISLGRLQKLLFGKRTEKEKRPPHRIPQLRAAKAEAKERLRCNACGNTVTAELPAEAGPRKYTPSAQASVAVLKYSGGMAFHRLHLLEQYQGVPLPASIQWEMVEEATNALFSVYRELYHQAAAGSLLFIDDTPAQTLELGKH